MPDVKIVTRQLAVLSQMDVKELQEKYAELYGYETKLTSIQSLRRRLAYRIQEVYYGGLSKEEKESLEQRARRDPLANLDNVKLPPGMIPRGTRFSREWHGKVYEVIATGQGTYEYAGCTYRSLTAITQAITGTKWNGKKFFGIRN